jgi:hypothetical protein
LPEIKPATDYRQPFTEMGLKFAGRTDSRGARFLRGAPVARGLQPHTAASAGAIYLGAAAVIGVLCLFVALFRHPLGANERIGFWPIFAALPVVLARLAEQNSTSVALSIALGVLVLATLWHFGAQFLGRRAGDAIVLCLLTFQFFFLARYGGSLLPSAAPLSLPALPLAQKINLVLQLVLPILLLLWSARPAAPAGYESRAPSRVTRFLKKRRMPWRIAGLLLMALVLMVTFFSSRLGFGAASTPANTFSIFRPPLLFGFWLVLDCLYFGGRALWQRVH